MTLANHFASDPHFLEIIKYLETEESDRMLEDKEKRKARHRAQGFLIEDGKLWQVAHGRQA